MNLPTKYQSGSPNRDRFKLLHKLLMPDSFWALDADLELVSKHPTPFIVARLDFKLATDAISFSEAIAYRQFMSTPMPFRIPVYIVEAISGFEQNDTAKHRFDVYQPTDLNHKPDPPTYTKNHVLQNGAWADLQLWERNIRRERESELVAWLNDRTKSA